MTENETLNWFLSIPTGKEDCELDSKKKTVKRDQLVKIHNNTGQSSVEIKIQVGVFADNENLETVDDFQYGSLGDTFTEFITRSDPQKNMVLMWFGCADYSETTSPAEIYVDPPG